jgi:hypothetical protein
MIRREHRLKEDHDSFEALWFGAKRFELRFNDRNYECGDRLQLLETKYSGEQMREGKPLKYTHRVVEAAVSHILYGPKYGLKEGWAILSIIAISKYKLRSRSFNKMLAEEAT